MVAASVGWTRHSGGAETTGPGPYSSTIFGVEAVLARAASKRAWLVRFFQGFRRSRVEVVRGKWVLDGLPRITRLAADGPPRVRLWALAAVIPRTILLLPAEGLSLEFGHTRGSQRFQSDSWTRKLLQLLVHGRHAG